MLQQSLTVAFSKLNHPNPLSLSSRERYPEHHLAQNYQKMRKKVLKHNFSPQNT